jgi:cephalosporin-C deacetylase-like acetyl esterase
MVERRDVEFGVDGGDRLRGWLFLPSKRAGRLPAISPGPLTNTIPR